MDKSELKNKRYVLTEINGVQRKFSVKRPTPTQFRDAQLEANKAFRKAIESDALTREKIDEYMRANSMWNDEKQKQLETLAKQINEGERQLARGGKTKDGQPFSLKQARALALEIRGWRYEQTMLLAKRRELDQFTVQGQAENAKFDYLVSVCTVDEDGKPVFTNTEDYYEKSSEKYVVDAASELGNMLFGLETDFEKKHRENVFLKEQGFVDEDLHLINPEGRKVDLEGRLLNKDGRYIDKEGNFIDGDGNRIDEEGQPIEEFAPFVPASDDPVGYFPPPEPQTDT